ncbi:MAG: hypothetical protein A2V86_07875 [Deltaproteobacteria bacterium RBG_16_49_23]|nr:MAG: hypothetical protein A2V86_07875 [Deltaproteobacteria bacterium RBG_16_49_23]
MSTQAVAQIDFTLRQACSLRARGSPSGTEAPLGRSLSRRLIEPFTLREPQGERRVEMQMVGLGNSLHTLFK